MNEDKGAVESNDPGLEALFRRTHAGQPDETFVAATMRRVAVEKARRRLGRRLVEAAGLIGIVAASPWLIDASVRLSALLDAGLTLASDWLRTPTGMACGVAFVAALLVIRPLLARWAPLLWHWAVRRR